MLKRIVMALFILCLGTAAEGRVILRIVASNPSEFESQEVTVRSYLPKGISRSEVIDSDGMEIRYDDQREQYYVTTRTTLEPQGSIAFNVELEDIWLITPERLDALANVAGGLAEKLTETAYGQQAQDIRQRVVAAIQNIRERQQAARIPEVSPSEHISAYNNNLALLSVVESDIQTLDKLYARASSDVLLKDRPKGVPPNIGMIWKVIFVIITFLGVTSAIFFLIWSRQLQKIREAEKLES